MRALFRISSCAGGGAHDVRRGRADLRWPGCCSRSSPSRWWCSWYRRLLRERAARRAGWPRSAWSRRARRRRAAAAPAAGAPAASRWWCCVVGAGPAGGHRAAAPPRGHGDPRLRRVGEHGRQGPRADPDRRREGRGARVRAEAAVHRAGRRRGVQRQRAGHPGAHHGQGDACSPRSTASRPQGGTALGQRAADARSRAIVGQAGAARQRARQPARAARAGPRLPRVGRGDPALRRREHHRRRTRSTSPTSRPRPG